MKKVVNIFFSTRLMGMLFIAFALAMGIATFIENDYNTQTAKALVYNTWWFEGMMLLFMINFFGNMFRYRLFRKEKWAVLLFHLSFVFIILGAGITRYFSYEGTMSIKEGESSNTILSRDNFLNLIVDNGKEQKAYPSKFMLLSAKGTNNFTIKDAFRTQDFSVQLVNYIPNVKKEFVAATKGNEYLLFVDSSTGGRQEYYIKRGSSKIINNVKVGFENPDEGVLNFSYINGALQLKSLADGSYFKMATKENGTVKKDSVQKFNLLSLYTLAGLKFVVPKTPIKGNVIETKGNKNKNPFDKLVFNITSNNESKQVAVKGRASVLGKIAETKVGGLNFRLQYGAKIYTTPFQIKLNDFQLEKYPGSNSPASFASEITVIDKDKENFNFRIFMNNILNYRGYKFFQSSYEINKEEGYEETHLSVNHDFWGTAITYLGYNLLFLGMLLSLFQKETRFGYLRKTLKKLQAKRAITILALFITFSNANAQHNAGISKGQIDSILSKNIVSKKHAEKFSTLVIQDFGGRMKPVHTFASQLLTKVSHSNTYNGMDANQVFISIIENPRFWFQVPFIYLGMKGNHQIRKDIGVPINATHASLADFYTNQGVYKLEKQQETAFKHKIKSKFDLDYISVDDRLNLLYAAVGGSILRIFPLPNDVNNKWVSHPELSQAHFKGTDSVYVKQIIPAYISVLQDAKRTNNYSEANTILEGIKQFQKKYGATVLPSEGKIKAEIAYNKLDIFKKLMKYYGMVSVLLIFLIIIQIFKSNKALNLIIKIGLGIIVLLFLAHTAGLIMRWYISGHAPWSNGYESMVYVTWATMLFGLFFGRKSSLTIAATAFVAAILLWIAHMNFMDPEISNLQPVLNSYWLMVHVAIIVASYGPFTLALLLATISLLLMAITTLKNKGRLDQTIKELTVLTEMAITVGLVMLTIGNFLGGIWANESWGRYWGWDPKETWALISIMIYAFVLHTRLIPGLRGRFAFNTMAVFAFASIIMTYLGVNHLLSGLHSYATGDAVNIPMQIWYWLGGMLVLSIFAYYKFNKHYQK